MVNKGTVASRMAATAESMDCSPQEIKKKGTATLVMPRISSGDHSFQLRGSCTRWIKITAMPKSSPKSVRKATSVMGPTSCTAILIHIKEELQIAPNKRNTNQCLGFTVYYS